MYFLAALSLLVCLSVAQADNWVLLVAGSNGWWNYRHQADVCHAYQIVQKHGIPDERIVVMMYDDIAHNEQNPNPGVVINRPHGPNNYENVLKDYTKDEVTPENFIKVLSGDKEGMRGIGSGKVIESTEKDNIFIYFTDHGAPGFLAFPNAHLTRHALNQTLARMYAEKKYAKMTIYVEACESGSMFDQNLLEDQPEMLRVYAVTAANSTTSSYACYCDSTLGCLADQFSAAWLQDSDRQDLTKETLATQYKTAKAETPSSTVMKFGRYRDFGQLTVSMFQGAKDVEPMQYEKVPCKADPEADQKEIGITMLKKQIAKLVTQPVKQAVFKQELKLAYAKRRYFDRFMTDFLQKFEVSNDDMTNIVNKDVQFKNMDHARCHHETLQVFSQKCYVIGQNPYTAKFVGILANLCQLHNFESESITDSLAEFCQKETPLPKNII